MPHSNHYHPHIPFWKIDNNTDLVSVFIIRFIRDIIHKLALIYVPLLLFGLADAVPNPLTINQVQWGLLIVALYYGGMRFMVLLTSKLGGWFVATQGLRNGIMLGLFIHGLYLASFQFVETWWWVIILTAIFQGVSITFFWNSFHTILSSNVTPEHTGQDLGLISFLSQLASMLSPVIGGLIIVTLGYSILFMIALMLLMISIGISFRIQNIRHKHIPTLTEFRTWFKEAQFRRLCVALSGKYFNDASIALWPLYIFLFLGAIEKVGYLYSLSMFVAMAITFLTGFYIDYSRGKRPFFLSGGFLSVIWILRSQVGSVWNIAVVDTMDRLTATFHWLFYDSLMYKRASGKKALAFFVYREAVMSVGAVLFWSAFGIAVYLTTDPWQALFAIAAVGVLSSLLMNETHTT